MTNEVKGNVVIDSEECKGCGLCVESCPTHVLELQPELNAYGVHPAAYKGENCNGCGICFYCCPEPGAITVYKAKPPAKGEAAAVKEVAHAATV
jgi:2-oxoglutarate ferredoxin oxidoreductase subunit delta